jgi:hypothetical protein
MVHVVLFVECSLSGPACHTTTFLVDEYTDIAYCHSNSVFTTDMIISSPMPLLMRREWLTGGCPHDVCPLCVLLLSHCLHTHTHHVTESHTHNSRVFRSYSTDRCEHETSKSVDGDYVCPTTQSRSRVDIEWRCRRTRRMRRQWLGLE